MKAWLLTVGFIFCLSSSAYANNLTISNVSLEDRNASAGTMVVQFNLRWDHSWRKDDGRKDAAWVFIKIYKNTTAPWIHGKLKTAGTNPADTYEGSNADTEIIIPSDKIGAFIQRKATGNGTFSSNKIKLTLDLSSSGVSSSDTIQVEVFGIEMVYIPTGPFYIGDGDGQNESSYAFHLNGADNTAVQITTASKSITVDSNGNDDIDTSPISVTGGAGITSNSSWPNGYNAFYVMKYEMSTAQYVDFLNNLSRTQQGNNVAATVSGNTITNTYVLTNSVAMQQRCSVRAPASGNGTSPTTIVFGSDFNNNATFNETDDGQNIPLWFLYWKNILAYADWAGLRPMTELEFEKACRGPNSAYIKELAWGTTSHTYATGPSNSGRANESASNAGQGLSVLNLDLYADGPFRSGFTATNTTTRASAGASYYGVMELSGNLAEPVVTIGKSEGRTFTGTHGDGTLTTTSSYEGNATNNDWPGIDATTSRGVTSTSQTGSGVRGGGIWNTYLDLPRVSDRTYASSGYGTQGDGGGRFVRTAP